MILLKCFSVIKRVIGMALVCSVICSMTTGAFAATSTPYHDFIRGVDISMLNEIETRGGKYYENRVQKDAMQILKNHGANYVRLKLWVNPYDAQGKSYGGGGNDFNTTLHLAQRAKNLGLKVLIDFHFSDFWADPGTQSKPKTWKNLTYSELKSTMYTYVKSTMNDFCSNGVMPDMVQLGNEISSGILWDDGKVGGGNNNFKPLAQLLQSAISGVRDSSDNRAKIILHLDNGGSYSLYQWWFDSIMSCGVSLDFNIIGLTYYPMWHGTLSELQYNMNDISKKYNKDVLIVETAYGWTTADGDGLGSSFNEQDAAKAGYPASADGQSRFISDLKSTLLNVPNNRGLGFFYWEPDWVPVAGANWGTKEGAAYINDNGLLSNPWDNLTLFDFQGNVLQSIDCLNEPHPNLIKNSGFEADGYTNSPSQWQTWLPAGVDSGTIKTESSTAYSGQYDLSFWNQKAYTASAYQKVTGLQNGTYTLSAWIRRGGKQKVCQLYAKYFGGSERNASLPISDTGWSKVTVDNIQVTNGQCEIGLYTEAGADDWCNIDHVMFRKAG